MFFLKNDDKARSGVPLNNIQTEILIGNNDIIMVCAEGNGIFVR